MAKADYNVADRPESFPVTANDKLAETVAATPDAENAAEALAAGVIDAAYIGYDQALDAYAAREDIEDLDSKNRRDNPTDFADAAHMRQLPNRSGGNGYAPDPDNAIVVDGAGATGSSSV